MLAGNRRTLNPQSATFLILLWGCTGAALGGLVGVLAGRAFTTLRLRADDGAVFFGALLPAHLLLPPGAALPLAVPLLALRFLRRRLAPDLPRLDGALPIAVALVAAALLAKGSFLLPPKLRAGDPLLPGIPLPGARPVTVSVHARPAYPDTPALHLPLRRLASELPGRRAALWTGRVPSRTRMGREWPRLLPGGGGVAWIPDRRLVRVLLAPWPAPLEDPPSSLRPAGTLADIVAATGIPVLRGPPAPDDPPLHLRLLEGPEPVDAATAGELRRRGVWIDVTLGAGNEDRIALTGRGVHLGAERSPVGLLDVTPTALHVLGLAVPRSCDGRVLVEYLERTGSGARSPRYRFLAAPASSGAITTDPTTSR
jgi:hypothetical protein